MTAIASDLFEAAHQRRQMHANSMAAYDAEQRKLGKREAMIVDWLASHGAATDRQVAIGLGFSHKSAVQPRISTLIEAGALREVGSTVDDVTFKRVRLVEVAK